MSEAPILVYLEADDEITAVIRRLRAAEPGRAIVVAPGRSRATSSAVALRLLAREEREIAIVGDALTRSLAAEAGLSAYASVDDARRAAPPPETTDEPRHAAIHVVRGSVSDETAPTMASALAGERPLDAGSPASGDATAAARDTETRSVPIVREPARPTSHRAAGASSRPRRAPQARSPLAAILGILAAFVLVAGVVGAVVLPSATIVIVPRSEAIPARPYEVVIEDPQHASGTVEASATVTATGSYADQAAASGTVNLYNWTFFPVQVPAGTYVAAGEQAFATQADVVVPRGQLTRAGTILAGDAEVAVVAAAIGPAANVAAHAIDTVVNEDIDARLRGFPENPERRVDNLAATAGGIDETGTEFTQEDVDAAVARLRTQLAALVEDERPAAEGAISIAPTEPPEPVIEGLDGLVGLRDEAEARLDGTLDWAVVVVDEEEVLARAEQLLAEDAAAVPDGHELLTDATRVTVGAGRLDGDRAIVAVEVAGRAAPVVDRAEVLRRVVGRTEEEAAAALADIGVATVRLWPGWVATVPGLEWRIDVRVAGPQGDGSEAPFPSGEAPFPSGTSSP